MKTMLSLFWSFLKIGAFTFGGGYAMIPLIENEVIDRKKWIGRDEFLELLTLAQSAPGPISLNTSVFVGYKVAGYRGAVSAVMGAILPSFVIILLIAVYLADFRSNRYVDAAFKGMRPAVVALIAAPVINLARGMGPWKIAAAVGAALLVWYFGISPVYFIAGGALTGIAYTFFNKKGVPRAKDDSTPPGVPAKPDAGKRVAMKCRAAGRPESKPAGKTQDNAGGRADRHRGKRKKGGVQ